MNFLKKFLFFLLLWTWGLPVSAIGWMAFIGLKIKGYPIDSFYNARVTYVYTKHTNGGLSIGPYIFIFYPEDHPIKEPLLRKYLIHEYGHTYQVLLLGPLYWLIVGIPSFLWANLSLFKSYRRKNKVSYYSLYCEGWANRLGQKATSENIDGI